MRCRAVAIRRGVPSRVKGRGVFFERARLVGVRSPFRMQNFLWVFLDIKAILWYSGCKDGDVVIHLGEVPNCCLPTMVRCFSFFVGKERFFGVYLFAKS